MCRNTLFFLYHHVRLIKNDFYNQIQNAYNENATYEENMTKLLKKLDGVEDEFRTARFRTIISFVDGINDFHVEGTIEGKILQSRVGSNGFGYDPIFCSTKFNLSLAQMNSEQKNQISHRGLAIKKFVSKIRDIL